MKTPDRIWVSKVTGVIMRYTPTDVRLWHEYRLVKHRKKAKKKVKR